MSSNIRRLQANTRERILSTDWNNATALHHRALIEAGAALLQGDASIYGVVRGLTVSTTGGILLVRVAAGLALRSGTAPTTYDSNTQWIELRSATDVDLTALVDGANPRWVVIEIAEASAVEISEARDIFDPVTGTFSTSSVTKVTGSSPTLTARAGTAAATPVFPSGTAGVIPLAYVYLGAGTVAIDTTDIVMCRPMLRSENAETFAGAGGRPVWGGGVSVAVAGTDIVLRSAGGRFLNHRMNWSIAPGDGTAAFAVTAPGYDGAAAPVADDVVYFYACPAPYPSGYDASLAPREHRPGTTALTRYQGLAAADVHNAVIVASVVEPQVDTPLGNPTAGNFSIICAPFSSGAVTFDRTTAVYVGAAFWDVSATDLLVQDVRGTWVMPDVPTSKDIDSGGAATYSLWNNTGGVAGVGDMLFPLTALRIFALVALRDAAQNSGTQVQVRITDSSFASAGGLLGYLFSISNDAAAATAVDLRIGQVFEVARSTGNITVNAVTVDASDNVHIYGTAYDDAILAAR